MPARVGLVLLFVVGVACGSAERAFVGEYAAPVVYGDDDRVEVYNHPSEALTEIAKESVVALIDSNQLEEGTEGQHIIFSLKLQQSKGLCDDERFVDQPTAANCSGVLIDSDLVLTAGHCIRSAADCEQTKFVFNYYNEGPGQLAGIGPDDVYDCRQIALRDETSGRNLTPDYAVVQLDRAVTGGHGPAPVRAATVPLAPDEPVSMIGFGSGLPAKIDSGGVVADPRTSTLDYFIVNADAFAGHSGSPTFDRNDMLAGILIAGRAPDYVEADGQACNRVNTFEDDMAGEAIHYFAPIVSELCEEGWGGDRLCGDTSCEGQPCGVLTPPIRGEVPGGTGVTGDASGCRAGRAPLQESPILPVLAVLLALVATRLRRPAA